MIKINKDMLHIDQFINELLEGFTPKQRKVLSGRFGLKNGKRATLQEIGDELGITRERVRQIEEQTMERFVRLCVKMRRSS